MKCLTGDPSKLFAINLMLAEPFTDLMGERAGKIGVIEDRSRQRGAEQRIAGKDGFGLAANGTPKLIDGRNFVLGHDGPSRVVR